MKIPFHRQFVNAGNLFMENEKRKSKKLSLISKQNIVAVLVILLIVVYVLAQCYTVLNVQFKTQTAVVSTVYDTIDAKALIVRDEQAVLTDGNSVTVPVVQDGEKVQLGGRLAMQFSGSENAQRYSKYLELSEKLKYYSDMESQAVGHVTDVESLDKAILSDINDYIRCVSAENISSVSNHEESLNDKFTRRQMLIGENIDFSSVTAALTSEISALDIGSANPTGYLTAEKSGIFSTYSDGLESTFDYGKIDELNIDTLNSYIASAENAQPSQAIGKIIKSFDWYFCAVVDTAELVGLKNGRTLEVALKNSSDVYKCEIVKGAGDTQLGEEKTVLVLKCNEMNSDITSLRLEDIQIRTATHEGIKVPLDAVHIEDNQKGVYVLVSSVVKWRPAEVLYTGENFAVLTYDNKNYDEDSKNKGTENGIKLYDQIIIQGKELHDGKVYA